MLKAMGRAIHKAVTIAEILKRKIPLHQWNVLSSMEMIDRYEPIEEGLDMVENRRYVSCLTITLSRTIPIILTDTVSPNPSNTASTVSAVSSVSVSSSAPITSSSTAFLSNEPSSTVAAADVVLDIHHCGYQAPLSK
jgi:DNA-binding protein